MNDEVAVGMTHRCKHTLEQKHARLGPELQPIAIRIDRLTLDILEHEVGLCVVEDTGIDEPRDVRMIEPREQPTLAAEALLTGLPEPVGMDELDRNRALEASVRASRPPDASHAAAPDLGFDQVRTDAPPD